MLILDQQNVNLKRLINIQKCHSFTELDHCGVEPYEDCKYIIDDVVFDEHQMLEMFGLTAMNGYPSESRRWPNGVLAYTIDTNTIASGSAEETRILQQITRFNNEMSGCLSIV